MVDFTRASPRQQRDFGHEYCGKWRGSSVPEGPLQSLPRGRACAGQEPGGQWGVQLRHLREKSVDSPYITRWECQAGRGRERVPTVSDILQKAGCGPGGLRGPGLPRVLIKWHKFLMKRRKVRFNYDVFMKTKISYVQCASPSYSFNAEC